MEVISCSALSKVLGVQVEYVDESILIKKTGSYLCVRTEETLDYEIHFLLEKCKNWIRKSGFSLNLHLTYIDDDNRTYVTLKIDSFGLRFSTDEDSEQEAVIKAVEYVSANMEKDQK